MGKANDLTGMVFGMLTVLGQAGRAKDRHVMWECKCLCGNLAYVNSRDLKNGHTKSCGCLQISGTPYNDPRDHENGEFILLDRIQKIKSTIGKYGEGNFCISFSGGAVRDYLGACLRGVQEIGVQIERSRADKRGGATSKTKSKFPTGAD